MRDKGYHEMLVVFTGGCRWDYCSFSTAKVRGVAMTSMSERIESAPDVERLLTQSRSRMIHTSHGRPLSLSSDVGVGRRVGDL